MARKVIYLDNAATKKTVNVCWRAVKDVLMNNWGNPSSFHSYGNKAKRMMDEDRKTVAKFINAKPRKYEYFISNKF